MTKISETLKRLVAKDPATVQAVAANPDSLTNLQDAYAAEVALRGFQTALAQDLDAKLVDRNKTEQEFYTQSLLASGADDPDLVAIKTKLDALETEIKFAEAQLEGTRRKLTELMQAKERLGRQGWLTTYRRLTQKKTQAAKNLEKAAQAWVIAQLEFKAASAALMPAWPLVHPLSALASFSDEISINSAIEDEVMHANQAGANKGFSVIGEPRDPVARALRGKDYVSLSEKVERGNKVILGLLENAPVPASQPAPVSAPVPTAEPSAPAPVPTPKPGKVSAYDVPMQKRKLS